MYRTLVAFVLLGILAGCSQPAPTPSPQASESPSPQVTESDTADQSAQPSATPGEDEKPVAKDVGDAESMLFLEGKISGKSKAPNIRVDDLQDARYLVSLETLDITPPYPKALWILFIPQVREDFSESPLAVRYTVYRDEAPVGKKVVVGQKAFVVSAKGVQEDGVGQFDVFADAGDLPDTLLVYATMEIVIFPLGTDPATIDPETAQGDGNTMTTKSSNPIRINLLKAGQTEPGFSMDLPPADAGESASPSGTEAPQD